MDIKLPAIITAPIVLLLFIINIAAGNSILVTLLRVIIGGALIFGIILGLGIVFKDVLKIDLSSGSNKESAGKSKVDYVVGDEESNSETGSDEESTLEEMGNKVLQTDFDNEESSEESSSIIDNATEGDEDSPKDFGEVNTDVDGDYDDIDDDSYASTDYSSGGGIFDDDSTSSGSGDAEGAIKDKLGVDASPEEIAKAIRTKLNREKE